MFWVNRCAALSISLKVLFGTWRAGCPLIHLSRQGFQNSFLKTTFNSHNLQNIHHVNMCTVKVSTNSHTLTNHFSLTWHNQLNSIIPKKKHENHGQNEHGTNQPQSTNLNHLQPNPPSYYHWRPFFEDLLKSSLRWAITTIECHNCAVLVALWKETQNEWRKMCYGVCRVL